MGEMTAPPMCRGGTMQAQGCTTAVPWVPHGCPMPLLEPSSSVAQTSPFSSWHRHLHRKAGRAARPGHRDELLVPKDTDAPWSFVCSGEDEEHPGPIPPSHGRLELLQWPCGCGGVGAGGPDPLQHRERPLAPFPVWGLGTPEGTPALCPCPCCSSASATKGRPITPASGSTYIYKKYIYIISPCIYVGVSLTGECVARSVSPPGQRLRLRGSHSPLPRELAVPSVGDALLVSPVSRLCRPGTHGGGDCPRGGRAIPAAAGQGAVSTV